MESQQWKIESSISLGDLLLFLSIAGVGAGFVIHQEARQVKVETEAVDIKTLNDTRFNAIALDLARLQLQEDRMEKKVDHLLEEGSRKK
jgi:hypothetical protein